MHRFYLLNIIHPSWDAAADYWLGERKAAVVFYGDYTLAELRQGISLPGRPKLSAKAIREAGHFLRFQHECAVQHLNPIMVSIHRSTVWIYRPIGEPKEDSLLVPARAKTYHDRPKYIPVEVLARLPSSGVPAVLAGMRANRHFSSGTFVEIDPLEYHANVSAIQKVLGMPQHPPLPHPLDALGALEFETLLAKIFEEEGAFVPAYRGGTGEGVDLFIHQDRPITSLGLRATSRSALSLQLKAQLPNDLKRIIRWLKEAPENDRFLIINKNIPVERRKPFIEAGVDAAVLDRLWLLESLERNPQAARWLTRSTSWASILPREEQRSSQAV